MAELATSSDQPEGQSAGHGRKLDDVMLAMDVVDTLRSNQRLVERELTSETRDSELIERLREIYAAQGIEVSDDILLEGVEALKRQRFSYEPTPPGFATFMATLYVKRAKWGLPLAIGGVVLAVLWGGYHFAIDAPRQAALENRAIELTQQIPVALSDLQTEIAGLALVDDANQKASAFAEDGMAAVESGELELARAAEQNLRSLRETLAGSYEIRIVARPGEPSGAWRIPDANSNARNYYLIAEAISANGQIVTVPITSEEDGKTANVDKWGLRVGRAVFEAVGDDKSDDGIIQNNRLGVKRRGYLEPEYTVQTTGGAILEW
ncbi:MAG TPA: DUF6384 family protein [Thermohalobaculum sp.]|nr:DUF6384 family protein [Thermohalobaculum sp.]